MTTIECGRCKKATNATPVVHYARYRCNVCGRVNEVTNVMINEWLGFVFDEYLQSIKEVIDEDEFVLLRAKAIEEVKRGKFSSVQVGRLKTVLKQNFDKGGTIRDIRDDVLEKVRVRDLKVLNKAGEVQQVIPKEVRALSIARTETTRLANLGAERHYKRGGVREVVWVAAMTDRTCPICVELNGRIFKVGEGDRPPAHVYCRCSTIPRVEL